MAEFINTIDVLGDDAVIDSIIDRTITEFKDDKLTEVGDRAFCGCTALETVDLPNADFKSSTQIGYQFQNCTSLVDVNIPSATQLGRCQFTGCTALQRLVLPNVTKVQMQAFTSCTSLKTIDCYKQVNGINGSHFNGCKALKSIILRGDTLTPLAGTNFMSTPYATGEGYFYVPRALVDSYKAATNWSTYADQFRALEDYTVDGTTTGELDETKI